MKAQGHERTEGARIKDAAPGNIEGFEGKIGVPFQIAPNPKFIGERDQLFVQLYEKQQLAAKGSHYI